jgi:1-phosphofructokinase family hexose kinase
VILCVAANPSIDRLFAVEELTPGQIHRPVEAVQVAGGKGLNVARAAAALGAEVQAAALLGGHSGRWIAEQLEQEGVALEAVWKEGETRTSMSVAGSGAGLTEFYEHGPAVTAGDWRRFAGAVERLAAAARWMTLSGSLPPGSPADGYEALIPHATTAFDSREAGIDACPQVVKLNEVEADAAGDPIAAARRLQSRSKGAVVVTMGAAGAVMLTPGGDALEGRVDVTGAYPVGSGDAFLAGLVVSLGDGAGWDDALALALGAGAANAEVAGAGRLDGERAHRLAERARVRPAG